MSSHAPVAIEDGMLSISIFPVELYIHILLQLPAREPGNNVIKTIVSFLSASTITRAAALERTVWEYLYRSRYLVSSPDKEKERWNRLQGDWQLMYIERYKLDRAALQLLDHIRTHPYDRKAPTNRFAQEISFDGWDALELEARIPIPRVFRDPAVDDMDEEPLPEALPRRYWARATLGALSRLQAVRTWRTTVFGPTNSCTFEDLLTALSTFVDVPSSQIVKQFDALAARCRQRLSAKGLELDHAKPEFDLSRVIVAIRDFIHDEGFAIADGPLFYHSFNQFPHFYLDVGRSHMIPMSITHVFCSICSRLGIEAAPTNTPRKILCFITSPNPQKGDILFDLCDKTPPLVFSTRETPAMLAEAGMPTAFPADAVRPASASSMLGRVINNVFSTMQGSVQHQDQHGHGMGRVQYAVTAAFFTINAGIVPGALAIPPDCPLDEQIVFVNGLVPLLPEDGQEEFMMNLRAGSSLARSPKYTIHPPRLRPKDWKGKGKLTFRGFVGEVVSHPEYGLGCVIGWEIIALPPGDMPRHTGTYQVLTKSGIQLYLDEGPYAPAALSPSNLLWLHKHIRQFERFFEDAHVPREDGVGGRLIPTMELRQQYPDDLEAGVRWSEQQLSMACRRPDDA